MAEAAGANNLGVGDEDGGLDFEFNRSRGGSQGLISKRKRKPKLTYAEKKACTLARVQEKLGKEAYDEVVKAWGDLNKPNDTNGADWEKGNGIILNLINLNFSEIEIMSILGVGSYRIQRLRQGFFEDKCTVVHRRKANDFKYRILHFIFLATFTHVVGKFLMRRFDWSFLSAYTLSCSVICQFSNIVTKVYKGMPVIEDDFPKRKENNRDAYDTSGCKNTMGLTNKKKKGRLKKVQ